MTLPKSQLLVVHKILIGSAIGLAAIFGVRSIIVFAGQRSPIDLVLGLLSIGVGVALATYLRRLLRG